MYLNACMYNVRQYVHFYAVALPRAATSVVVFYVMWGLSPRPDIPDFVLYFIGILPTAALELIVYQVYKLRSKHAKGRL